MWICERVGVSAGDACVAFIGGVSRELGRGLWDERKLTACRRRNIELHCIYSPRTLFAAELHFFSESGTA